MVNLIIGPRGCGKTKKFIEVTNAAAEAKPNCVVCIEKGSVSRFSVSYHARLIDIDEFKKVDTYREMQAVLCGLLAGNYDISEIFIDSIFRICGRDMAELKVFLEDLNELSEKNNVKFTITLSEAKANIPDDVIALAADVCVMG